MPDALVSAIETTDVGGRIVLDLVAAEPVAAVAAFVADLVQSLPADARGPAK
jgi:hypothetical protein